MADTSREPGWWLAADGKWYPPEEASVAPPPTPPGWWLASDGRWYPPEQQTQAQPTLPPPPNDWHFDPSDNQWHPPSASEVAATRRSEKAAAEQAARDAKATEKAEKARLAAEKAAEKDARKAAAKAEKVRIAAQAAAAKKAEKTRREAEEATKVRLASEKAAAIHADKLRLAAEEVDRKMSETAAVKAQAAGHTPDSGSQLPPPPLSATWLGPIPQPPAYAVTEESSKEDKLLACHAYLAGTGPVPAFFLDETGHLRSMKMSESFNPTMHDAWTKANRARGGYMGGLKEAMEELHARNRQAEEDRASAHANGELLVHGLEIITAKKLKKLLDSNSYIKRNDTVRAVIPGPTGSQAIIALEDRLLVAKAGFMAGATGGGRVTTFRYIDIVGVQVNTGITTGWIIIQTAGVNTTSGDYWASHGGLTAAKNDDPFKLPNTLPVNKAILRAHADDLEQIQALVSEAHSSPVVSVKVEGTASTAKSIGEQIAEVTTLHAQGALSDDEYHLAKQRILQGGS